MLTPLLIAAVVGYFLGALPFGWLVARSRGINIFEHGSKNPGATNVRRVCGKGPGNLVFFLDAVKGAVATGWPIWAVALFPTEGSKLARVDIGSFNLVPPFAEFHLAVAGLVAALIGHSFSCFTKFKGGKGVATASGGFLVLMPLPLLCGLGVWLATFYTTRYVSLASMLAAIALPIAAFFFKQPNLLIGLGGVIALFVVLRHRANITRLLNGTESKFVKKPAEQTPSR
ncbi:acyl-phosphate glycerol 3-phosphate acyltransferase [Nibricoccus aquaticus]|uniref:Glycerol-3-phosphate acyltransferase n=1 Tax=Nibricoccus aquaticus TaxID=2576891 RepID=A0A290QAB5_9BACT|nr:glycerol-3-phosphate 1-O-acyltransferase PlsY [Nibricoccus aquaticus]ATC65635.1 acyl-phosphate glycerol 3-phosphate acyltransferase [Nibricoccus aquaticus]